MTTEWDVAVIDDVVEDIIDRRGITPRKLGSDFTAAGHRVISAKLIKEGRVDLSADEPRFVDPLTYRRWMKTPLLPDDVVLTSEAPLGEVAYIQRELEWCAGQRLFVLRTDKSRLHGRFLYYALRGGPVRHDLRSRATGTTAQGIRQSELRRVSIPLPPLSEQRAIAAVLGALDDKIELNELMNATLDEMARALFKSWFVDFDPVRAKAEGRQPSLMDAATAALFPDSFEDSALGPIPAGWRVSTVGEVAKVIDCLHSKKPARQDAGQLLLQLSNVKDDGLIDTSDSYWISDDDYARWTSRMEAKEGDCVITNVGRVGAVGQVPPGVSAALGRNMTGIRPKDAFPYHTFLISTLLSEAMRNEVAFWTDSGSVMDSLNVRSVPKLRFIMSDESVVEAFESLARPLRCLMEANLSESRTLAELRDALLPRLISGELRVGDVACILGRVC